MDNMTDEASTDPRKNEARRLDLLPSAVLLRNNATELPSRSTSSGGRYVGYRRSNTAETTTKSQARQQRNIVEYGAELNLIRFRDDFVAEGVSGSSIHDRHAFRELMELVMNKAFDVVVVEDIDRFSRNSADTLKYFQLMASHKVELHDVSGRIRLSQVPCNARRARRRS